MNRAGEVPSDEEIQYSLIKAKVPSLKYLDKIANGFMQPSRLANIAMLSYLAREGKWINNISIGNINDLSHSQKFVDYITNELQSLLSQIKDKVVYSLNNECGMPNVNFVSVALHYPELFRLLLYFVDKGFMIDNKNLIAFISLIVIYGNGIKFSTGYNLYKDSEDWLLATRTWFFQAIRQGELLIPPSPIVYQNILDAVYTNVFKNVEMAWNNPAYIDSLNATWHWTTGRGRFLLLYSTRKYLEENFPDYDPVDITWCEENRPWDYDHIFPKDWLRTGRGIPQGEYHQLVNKFLNSIGHIAPIAFSQNRGKGTRPPCSYMEEDNEKLFVTYEDFFNEDHSGKNGSICLETREDFAFTFAKITATRWCKLYNEFYDSTELMKLLDFNEINDKRSNLFNTMIKQNSEFKCYFVLPNGTQQIVSSPLDMARPWIACGRTGTIINDANEYPCMICVASNGIQWEIGVRRHPEATSLINDSSRWWIDGMYECLTNAEEQEILEKFNNLLKSVDLHQITMD